MAKTNDWRINRWKRELTARYGKCVAFGKKHALTDAAQHHYEATVDSVLVATLDITEDANGRFLTTECEY